MHGLSEVLELATSQTHFDHPLCAKCLDAVGKELAERLGEAEALAHAHEAALTELQARPGVWCISVQRQLPFAPCLAAVWHV